MATKREFARFKAAARATAIKDRRVNIRLSSGDLSDIQVKALGGGHAVPNDHRERAPQIRDRPVGQAACAKCQAAAQSREPAAVAHG